MRSRKRSHSRKKSRTHKKSRKRSRTLQKSRTHKRSDLPMCPDSIYCGGKSSPISGEYDRLGNKDECFKKGMGVGMMIQLQQVKSRLASKGIILVTKEIKRKECRRKDGTIRT